MNDFEQPDLPLSPRPDRGVPRRGGAVVEAEADDKVSLRYGERGDGPPPAPGIDTPSEPLRPIKALPALITKGPFEKLRRALGFGDTGEEGPLRLIALPDDPLPGDLVGGMAVRAGHFLFRGIKLDTAKIGSRRIPLPDDFHIYIDGFAWLRDLSAAAPLSEIGTLSRQLTADWLTGHGEQRSGPAWRAEETGWRVMNIVTAAALRRDEAQGKGVLPPDWLAHLGDCERHLVRQVDRARKGRVQIVAATGGLAAALLLSRTRKSRAWHEKRLARAIREGIYPDGGIASRSPLSLVAIVEAFVLLASVYRALQADLPVFVADAQRRALGALRCLLHGDGGTGSWQGAMPLSSARAEALLAASRVVPRSQADVRDWGYQRIIAGQVVLVMDAAPPPAANQAETGCASTLAFEFSAGRERIIVNCGGGALPGQHISADLARGLRSTAAHSTLCLDDINSTAVEPRGRLGQGVDMVDCDLTHTDKGLKLEASHDGYDRRFGFVHRRSILLDEQGRKLRGLDTLLPGARAKKGRARPFAIRFHLDPALEIEMRPDGQSALLRLASGSLWHFRAIDGQLSIEDSLIVDESGVPREGWQLVIVGESGTGGMSSGWMMNQIS